MTSEQAWLVATGVPALVLALVATVVAARARRRSVRAEACSPRRSPTGSRSSSRPAADVRPGPAVEDGADESTYVITHLEADRDAGPSRSPSDIDGRLFADIVARETVVKAASWTAGLRRALSPESRNRIRFQVRQETKRAGRERRAETKQALREFRARERAAAGRTEVGEDVA